MNLWRILARSRIAAAGVLVALTGAVIAVFSSGPLPTQSSLGTNGRTTISGPFQNSEIVVGVSARVAGAIDSLTWKGREFVNSYDHGRELQSASQFNGFKECLNPTEAGSRDDGRGPSSSSQLISLETKQNQIMTRGRMAFWLAPGETSRSCPGMSAVNRQKLSDIELLKTVTVGAHDLPNVIEHDVTFRVPSDYSSAVFVPLSAHLPPSFSQFWTYDPTKDRLAELSDGPGEQALPVIIASPDGNYAFGVYSPDLPQARWPQIGYGRLRFDKPADPDNATVKGNCVFRVETVKAADYRYVCYSIVGSLQDVKTSMAKLVATLKHRAP